MDYWRWAELDINLRFPISNAEPPDPKNEKLDNSLVQAEHFYDSVIDQQCQLVCYVITTIAELFICILHYSSQSRLNKSFYSRFATSWSKKQLLCPSSPIHVFSDDGI